MQITLTGYSFRKTQVRPEGMVSFVHDSKNAYDDKAIEARYKDTHIGYIKRGSPEQEYIFNLIRDGKAPKATVVEYSFAYKDGDNLVFNKEHKGDLMHVVLEVEGHVGYRKDGKEYISITNLLKYINPTGTFDNLIKWALDSFKSHDEYTAKLSELSSSGTELHSCIEEYLKGKGAGNEAIKNFVKKYNPEVVSLEQTLFSDLGIAGTYDALLKIDGKLVVVDWKSSKRPQLKHKIQGSFYANELGADETWVVTFGGITKQGFSVCKVTEEEITKYSKVVEHLTKIYNLLTK